MPYLFLLWLASLLPPAPTDVRLADLRRFPPPCVVAEALAAAERCRTWAKQRESVEPHRAEAWCAVREAAYLHRRPWELLAVAQRTDDGYGGPVAAEERLHALRALRKRLGTERYTDGRMPCPLPLWIFPEVPPDP